MIVLQQSRRQRQRLYERNLPIITTTTTGSKISSYKVWYIIRMLYTDIWHLLLHVSRIDCTKTCNTGLWYDKEKRRQGGVYTEGDRYYMVALFSRVAVGTNNRRKCSVLHCVCSRLLLKELLCVQGSCPWWIIAWPKIFLAPTSWVRSRGQSRTSLSRQFLSLYLPPPAKQTTA